MPQKNKKAFQKYQRKWRKAHPTYQRNWWAGHPEKRVAQKQYFHDWWLRRGKKLRKNRQTLKHKSSANVKR